MRAVDTNVLVRLITRDDADQTASAEAFIEPGAWVSILAIAETCWVLTTVYDRDTKQVAAAMEMLINHGSLVIQQSNVVANAINLLRAKPSLGFSDCLLMELARQAGHLPLGTFDRALAKVEGARKL